jgi:hypothetical protein
MTPLVQRLRERLVPPSPHPFTGLVINSETANYVLDNYMAEVKDRIDAFAAEAVAVFGGKSAEHDDWYWAGKNENIDTHRAYLICIEEIPKERPKVSKAEVTRAFRAAITCAESKGIVSGAIEYWKQIVSDLEAGEVIDG